MSTPYPNQLVHKRFHDIIFAPLFSSRPGFLKLRQPELSLGPNGPGPRVLAAQVDSAKWKSLTVQLLQRPTLNFFLNKTFFGLEI